MTRINGIMQVMNKNQESIKNVSETKLPPEKRREYDKYWETISFEASLAETHEVELEQASRLGEKRGEQKAGLEIAQNLLKSGVDDAIVLQATGLTQEELNKLKKVSYA
jgi:predicted transposase/invertase (TIGR01784 family)